MIPDSSYNYEFFYSNFISGIDFKDTWSLDVLDPNQSARAYLKFVDRCGNDTIIEINYYPVKIEINPDSYDFGYVALGDTISQKFNLIILIV